MDDVQATLEDLVPILAQAMTSTRKLATVRRIADIQPIENADAIEVATIDGWQVVVKKGQFKPTELVIYCEIDSWIPHELAPFLSKGKEPREFNGIKGERLRTIKLRGQISQGLALPFDGTEAPEAVREWSIAQLFASTASQFEGADLTELLGVQKYEKPLPSSLAGKARGNFPSFIPKTDQERCQNIAKEIQQHVELGTVFEVTQKLNGSSMTVYAKYDKELDEVRAGVCSRNLDLDLNQEGNAFVDTAERIHLDDALFKYAFETHRSVAIQGELCGPKIQGNYEGETENEFYVFDIYDIDAGRYLKADERYAFLEMFKKEYHVGLNQVPILGHYNLDSNETVQTLLEKAGAQGKNGAGNYVEGLVYKSMSCDFTFKAISNLYLLNGGE